MNGIKSQRKRKKPSYLNDFIDSEKDAFNESPDDEDESAEEESFSKKKKNDTNKGKTKKNGKDIYIIEYLKEKDEDKFLVKWENFPDEENTWEPRDSIPAFILEVFF